MSPRVLASVLRVASLLAVLVGAPSVFAQYRIDQWTADNGLPQNSVRDIIQTRDGYIWLTTFDGLVRFDGVRFTVFNKGNSPGIPSNRFVDVFEASDGDVWAALETGEVVRYHRGRFAAFAVPGELAVPGALTFSTLLNLAEDGTGHIVAYRALLRLDYTFRTFTSITVSAFRLTDGAFVPAKGLDHTFALPLEKLEVSAIQWPRLDSGDFLVGTDRQLVRVRTNGTIDVYSAANGLPGRQPVFVDGRDGSTFALSRDGGDRLWLTDLATMQSQVLSEHFPVDVQIQGGMADGEGNLWFWTYDKGLLRARRQSVTQFASTRTVPLGEVYPVLETRDGSLVIGSRRNEVYRLENGTFVPLQPPPDEGFGFIYNVSSLYEDRQGRVLVGGLWRIEGDKIVAEPWASAVLEVSRAIWTACEDREGALWLGSDNGIWRVRGAEVEHFSARDGLAGDDTKVIVEDGRGGLWIGSYGGLTHYEDGKFTAWTERDGLPGSTIRALKVDPDGALWIGTYDSGLGRFKDGRFTTYTTKNGLFDNGVFQILEDDAGWFWMSCNRGIYRVRKQELVDVAEGRLATVTSLAFSKNDGMPSVECNGGRWPAGVRTHDGKLWFPTMAGVAMIDPVTISVSPRPPPVVIEAMRIDNRPVEGDAWEAALGNLDAPPSAIRVEPGQDNFEIDYTALSFVNSENLRFKYKLEGADRDWIDAGTRRTAYYSYIAPGDYTFRVIAANADGVWNETGASVRVSVVPPLWKTWWFLTLASLAAFGMLVVAWRYRESQLRREQEAQQDFARQLIESQENERKRIAGELHDGLGQNLLVVKNWALIALNQAEADGALRGHLEEISDTASLALDEVREIAHNLRPYQLERLGLTQALEFMLQQVRGSSEIEIAVEIEDVDGLLSPESEINVFRIVQEAVNNVVKHSEANGAWLSIARTPRGLRFVCRDDGKGFDPAAAARSRRSGMGLSGLAERVRMLGGRYTVESAPGDGATVTVDVDEGDL